MPGTGAEFGPCPFCGALHNEDTVFCPTSERQLDLKGRLLDGKFRFKKNIGQGGMGSVWLCENTLIHKDVAIKLMHPEFARNEGILRRFRNEATAAGRIGSDYICDILDLGKSELGPYIVMEVLRGEDLGAFAHRHRHRHDMTPGGLVAVLRQALIGLQAAHNVGIVHRDLKPENVFLHHPGGNGLVVKLMDFGISKFTEGNENEGGSTRTGVLMGTPEYMSPEQTEGAAKADARTDIWAMGLIAYWALTGVSPFLGDSLTATLVNVATREPLPLHTLNPAVSPELSAVIHRCLAKDPNARWQTAQALLDALAPFERHDELHRFAGVIDERAIGFARTVSAAQGLQAPSAAANVRQRAPGGTAHAPSPAAEAAALSQASFAPLTPAATPAGGHAETWSNEFHGVQGDKAPTMMAHPWADMDEHARPTANIQSSRALPWIVGAIATLVIVGGSGYFLVKSAQDTSVTVTAEPLVPSPPTPAAAALPSVDDAATPVVAPTPEPAAAPGPTEAPATEPTPVVIPPSPEPTKTPTHTTPRPAPQPTPPPKPAGPDTKLVRKVGSRWIPKSPRAATSASAAQAVCQGWKTSTFANLRTWDLPTAKQAATFAKKGELYWLKNGRVYSGTTKETLGASLGKKPLAVCVGS